MATARECDWVVAANPNVCYIVHGNHLQHLDSGTEPNYVVHVNHVQHSESVTEPLLSLEQDLPLVGPINLTL